ncbi:MULTISPECIES: hypothetical protein [Alistipes]|jgi:wac fibritin neck whiskers protein|uniref:hypothetical protein n=1 Tax=Alistipes TaxID=239759 RepID=UPI0011CABE4A|nr:MULTISPECIES: hypothetical protein [Alistipes]MCI7594023.1 hypothetical protein [Alistipes shahii]MDR3938312.1 hypothetical protein [Alistipes sp.]MDY4091525.1 hypothetical protein [Alistipes finegoldii]MDY4930396.1 hypothetical protein [Alistipes shahii]NMF22566.1 hypothetical protein [Alistipes shahii]
MKRKLSYAIVIALCGMMGFTSCTKDYDDDLRIHREMIENNEKELRATIDAYQVLVNNTIEQMEIAYKNADNLIKQEMKAEFDAAKARLTALETALETAKNNISALQTDLTTFKAAVQLDFQEVNNKITAINARIDDAELKITALDGRLTSAEQAIIDLKAWKTLAEGKLEDLKNSQTATAADVEALKTRINTAEGKITALETLCNNLKAEFEAADVALGQRIDDLTTALGTQETSLTALITNTQNALNARIDDFKSEMTTAWNDYKTTVDGKLAAMATQLTAVIADVNTLTGELATLDGKVGTLETAVANLTAQIAGLASQTALDALTTRVNQLTIDLAAKEAALKVLIDANKDGITANKAEIETLKVEINTIKADMQAMKTELTQAIADAVSDKVTQTAMDNAIAQLESDYKAADQALQALIDTINNTTLPAMDSKITALEDRMDTVEADIEAIKNRIQAVRWVPAYSDGKLTLQATKNVGGTEYDSAALEEQLYVTSANANIIADILDASKGYTVEVIANSVNTRAIVTSPFGTATVTAGTENNVLKIAMGYTDLATLWSSFNTATIPTPIKVQLAVKISDAKGNSAMTDFADVVIVNN